MNNKEDKELNKKIIEELEKEIKQCEDEAKRKRLKSTLDRFK